MEEGKITLTDEERKSLTSSLETANKNYNSLRNIPSKWEYKDLEVEIGGDIIAAANMMGEEGWELCNHAETNKLTITPREGGGEIRENKAINLLIFKRQK